jgi:hypothetical protein
MDCEIQRLTIVANNGSLRIAYGAQVEDLVPFLEQAEMGGQKGDLAITE